RPWSGTAWGKLGKVLLAHGLPFEARDCFIQAEKYDPREPRWPYLHAETLLEERFERKAELLERSVRHAGKEPGPRLALAEVLLRLGQLDRAERLFRQVLEAHPGHPRAHLGLGLLAYQRGRWEESREQLTRSAEGAPDVKATRTKLVEVYERLG